MKDGESIKTDDHDEIKNWAESRGGKPVKVIGAESGDALIRIHFPGFKEESNLEDITWDEFFQIFDKNKLALMYQMKTSDGKESRFSKIVHR